jgi:hypothetical protein
MRVPRVAKAQPWAEISERFQRYFFNVGLAYTNVRRTLLLTVLK